MQAIRTKVLGPTHTRGTRIVAVCAAKRVVTAFNHALSLGENHTNAAVALAVDLGWLTPDTVIVSGTLPDGSDCHVLGDSRSREWSRVTAADRGLETCETARRACK